METSAVRGMGLDDADTGIIINTVLKQSQSRTHGAQHSISLHSRREARFDRYFIANKVQRDQRSA